MHLCFSLVDQTSSAYLANDICKTGFCNIFFNAHHLSMFERTTRYRKIGHILPSSNFIIPIVWYERVCYPSLCSHSSNISSFYSTHFCQKKKNSQNKQK